MNDASRQNYRGEEAALAWQVEVGAARGEECAVGFKADKPGIAHWVSREAAAAWASCGAFEWVALGYLAASCVLILVLCRVEARGAERAEQQGGTLSVKFWHFWRHWYPHLFFLFCFEELGKLVHLVTPGWQDAKLIAADYWLTGVQPTVCLEQFATPARNDFMQFAYLTYFTYLLVLGGVLYYRRDLRGYWSVMTYSAAAYAIGY